MSVLSGEESPSEKQERLERHEELMQRKQERLEQKTSHPTGGTGASSGGGAAVGGLISTIADHKMLLFIIGGGVVLAYIVYQFMSNNSSSNTTAANASPNYANGAFLPSDISTQLQGINDQISSLAAAEAATPPTPTVQVPGQGPITTKPGLVPLGAKVWEGGSDSSGQRWWEQLPGGQQTLFYLPVGATVKQGAQGRWWYTNPGGQQQQLTYSPPAYLPLNSLQGTGQKG